MASHTAEGDDDDGAALLAVLSTASLWWVSADAEVEEDEDDDDDAGEGTLGIETGLAWTRAPLYWEKGQERTTALLLSSWPVLCWPVRIFITEPRPLMVEPAPAPPDLLLPPA